MSRLGPLGKEPIQLAMSLSSLCKGRHTLTVCQSLINRGHASGPQRQFFLPWFPLPLNILYLIALKVVQSQLHSRAGDVQARVRFRSDAQLTLCAEHTPRKLGVAREGWSATEVEQHRGILLCGLRGRQASRESEVVRHVACGCARHSTSCGFDEVEMRPL